MDASRYPTSQLYRFVQTGAALSRGHSTTVALLLTCPAGLDWSAGIPIRLGLVARKRAIPQQGRPPTQVDTGEVMRSIHTAVVGGG